MTFVWYQSGSGFCSVDVPQPEATALQSVQACAGRLGAADFSPARFAGSSFTCAKPAARPIQRGLVCANRMQRIRSFQPSRDDLGVPAIASEDRSSRPWGGCSAQVKEETAQRAGLKSAAPSLPAQAWTD